MFYPNANILFIFFWNKKNSDFLPISMFFWELWVENRLFILVFKKSNCSQSHLSSSHSSKHDALPIKRINRGKANENDLHNW